MNLEKKKVKVQIASRGFFLSMKKTISEISFRMGVCSLVLPFLTFGSILGYQWLAHGTFWQEVQSNPTDEANQVAAAMMGFSEMWSLLLGTGLMSVFGLALAVVCISNEKKILGVGTLALGFNGIPFLLMISLWLKGH